MKKVLVLAILMSSSASAESWVCNVEDEDPWLRIRFTKDEAGVWSVGGMPSEGDLYEYPSCKYAVGTVVCGGSGLEIIFDPSTKRAVDINVANHLSGYDDGESFVRLYWCLPEFDVDRAPNWLRDRIRKHDGKIDHE